MSDPRPQSPLAHRAKLDGDGVSLRERPFTGLAILRGDRVAITAATGLWLPREVRRTTVTDDVAALWLAPDEWLLVTPEEIGRLAAQLETALAGQHHQLVDVSDYYTAIELAGGAAREVLAKLVTIDLHPRHYRPGEAVATTLAKANVWCWLTADEVFRLFVRRSHADYVWCLLADAARAWGVPAQAPVGRVRLHLEA